MNLKKLFAIATLCISGVYSNAQFPGCPTIDAGLDQTLPCSQLCTDLTATPFPAGATNTYTVASIPHAPPIAYNQAGGTVVSANTDDVWSPIINLPFPFCYFGQTYTTCKVGSNGAIDMGPPAGGGFDPWSFNQNTPSAGLVDDGDIFGVLHDIDPSVCGQIKWYLLGTAPCRIFVVSFNNVCHFSCNSLRTTSMMVLYETTNVIDVYVQSKPTCGGWNGGNAIVGIQNPTGTAGLAAPGRNTNPGTWSVTVPEGWRFTPNGAPIYTVDWFQGATLIGSGNTINVCPTGTTTYTAQVTYTRCDGLQIVETDDVIINYSALPAPIVNTTAEICAGANDGTVTIDNAPGSGPYTVDITGPSNQSFVEPNTAGGVANFTGLPDGNYNYTVTDAGGCTFSGTFTIVAGPGCCSVTANGTNLVCNADNTGTITANPVGQAPFGYTWTNGGGTNQTGTTLPAGSYTVTMTDALGCTDQATVVITEPAALVANATPTDASCFGVCDGQVSVSAPTGGTAPYQYNINAGAFGGSSTFTNLCAGLYNVIVQDNSGCQLILAGNNVNEPTDVTLVEVSTVPATCGINNGELTVLAGGGTPGYQYDIGGGQQASANFTGLGSGNYVVTVTDLNGCTETVNVTVGNSAGPVPFIDIQNDVTCNGGLNGSVTVGVTGGAAPYLYSLDLGPNQPSNTFAVGAGAHTIVVTDNNGCTGSVNVNINEPTILTYNAVNTAATCNGVCDGQIAITANGATPPYTYSSDNGLTFQASNALTGLCAGNINVVVSDANGCLANSVEIITEPTAVTLTPTFVEPSCNGLADGTITFAGAGGTPPYTYSVDNGVTFTAVDPVPGIAAGNYNLVIQDANGCQGTGTILVTEPPAFNFNFIANNPSNCGAQDGSFEITATNGLAPYFYSIDGGTTIQVNNGFFLNLFSGLYNLLVTDANGCADSVFSALSDNVMVTQTDLENPTTCFGACDGTGIVSQQFGAPPFTYTINSTGIAQPSGVFPNLCAGQYFITIEDAGLCIGIQEVNILQPDTIEFTPTSTDPLCPAGADGTINFGAVTGGDTGPYTYSIDGGATYQAAATFNGLTSGTYTLFAQDGVGCLGSTTITLGEPVPWNVNLNATDLVCFNDNTGFVQVIGGGATPTYTYTLGGTPSITGIYAGLAANVGGYVIQVTDANGCTFDTTQIVNEPAILAENEVITNVTCNGVCDGTINVTANGGTAPYTYSSDGGVVTQSSNILANLCVGAFVVYVEDDNGCTIANNVNVTEPTAVGANIVSTPSTCGQPNGDITVTANGGTPGYTYSIDNGVTFQAGTNFPGLTNGNYDVVVQDANNCQYSEQHTVTSQNSPQIISANLTDVDCFGNCNGEIDVTANGGTGALTYDIGGAGQATGLFQNQCAGPFTITVTDVNGCTATQNVTITEPTQLTHTTVLTNLICFGDNSGIIDINANGGTLPYQYSFDGGTTFGVLDIANFLAAGNVNVVVQDANGCQSTSLEVLTEPAAMTITAQNTVNVTCFGLCDGTADVTVTGGTGAYTYTWSGAVAPPASNAANSLCSGGYSVDVTDVNGCLIQTVFNVTEPPMVVITSVSGTDALCNTQCDGTITINSAQATQYSVDNGVSFQAANNFTGLCAGNYDIVVQDANGCPQASTLTINEPAPLVLDPVAAIAICYGGDGTLEAYANGGTTPYYYIWEGVDTTQFYGVSGLTAPQSFNVTVFDINGCSDGPQTGNVTMLAPPFQAVVTPQTATICIGDDVTLTGSNIDGVGPYAYHWLDSNQDTLSTQDNPFVYTPAAPGTETLYMVGADECTYDTLQIDIIILDNPSPTFTVNPNIGCAPLTSTFVNTTPGNYTLNNCVWDFGDGNTFAGCTGVSNTYFATGCYDVTLSVTTDEGCAGTATVVSAVCVAEDPIPGFYWEPAQPSILDPTVSIISIAENAVTYSYTFEQGTSAEENPTVTFVGIDEETTITICQTVTSDIGCTADTCVDMIIYEDILFYVPNAITPDGDLFNESFQPVFTSGVDPFEYHLTIFNRWGEIIFESYNFDAGWDGHYGDGGLVKDGVYIWQIEFGEKLSDKKQTHRGHVTVLK
jgi:gliding motility-associated-like protein